jgi:hypothetical protein
MRAPFILAGLFVVAGCATARLSKGPDVYTVSQHPSGLKVGVAKVVDQRESTKAGSIGATSVRVDKDIADMTTNYLIQTLDQQMQVNVVPVEASTPAGVASIASQRGVDAVVVSQITSVKMFSADAIMQPVSTSIDMNTVVYNRDGSEKYRRSFSGKYEKRIGLTIVDKATGELVEEAVKDMMAGVGRDTGLKEALQASGSTKTSKRSE